jgi:hypothetical protein
MTYLELIAWCWLEIIQRLQTLAFINLLTLLLFELSVFTMRYVELIEWSKSSIRQQMHYLLILENSKIYIKT